MKKEREREGGWWGGEEVGAGKRVRGTSIESCGVDQRGSPVMCYPLKKEKTY